MAPHETSEIAFLGLCERAAYVLDGNTNLFKWDVIGLKQVVVSSIYPLQLIGWSLGFAALGKAEGLDHRF